MEHVTIRTTGGSETTLGREPLDRLAASLRGELLTRTSPGFDEARQIWNAMIDRRPALIARCHDADDVADAVRFAREHGLLVAVRGGGHNIAGNAMADGGFVIDLSPMKAVHVNPSRRTARIEPGATIADFDREAQAFGLATPLGINSTTGVAGLTLGGGYGWLSRKHGLTVDNLRSAELVTADGEMLTAAEQENSDLFWAIRGGGGNFGVVTAFEFALHPVGPEVLAGLIVHPFDNAGELLRRYREVVAAAPDELAVWVVLRKAPPLPFLPEAVHGTDVVVLAALYAGDAAAGQRALAPLRAIEGAHADVIGLTPYAGFQTAFDPLLAPGLRNYWKTHNFLSLDDALLDALVEQVRALPGPMCEIFISHLGGAVSRRSADATAYVGRDAHFIMNVHARWEHPAEDAALTAWARDVYRAAAPYASAGAYVNFLTHDEGERVRAAYGDNYPRLAAIKAKYDPTNLFRVNQNIVPSVAPSTPEMPGPRVPLREQTPPPTV